MGKEVNYYTFAEEDYLFLKANMEEKRIGNAMTSIAQNVCERYLKHVISVFCMDIDCTAVLKTHSLRKILRFMEENLFLQMRKMWQYAGKRLWKQKVRLTAIWRIIKSEAGRKKYKKNRKCAM